MHLLKLKLISTFTVTSTGTRFESETLPSGRQLQYVQALYSVCLQHAHTLTCRRGLFMKLSSNLSGEKNESYEMSRSGKRFGTQDLENKIHDLRPLETFRKEVPLTYRWGHIFLIFNSTSLTVLSSSVGIATEYALDGPGSNPGGDEIFRPSRPNLGPTQPPVKWIPGLFQGVKCGRGVLLTSHPFLVPRSWNSTAIPLPTLWATLSL